MMKFIIYALLILILVIGCGALTRAQTAQPAVACKAGSTAPQVGSWTWAENAQVKVYIRTPDFAVNEVPHILTAVQNWDTSSGQNGSGVRFMYQGTVSESQTCVNCLTITRGETLDKRHGAELKAFSKRRSQIIDYAWVVIDIQIRNPKTLTGIVAHELGHSLGLLDCYNCKRKSTAMTLLYTTVKFLQFKLFDLSNGLEGPTPCDQAQVKKAYQELKAMVRPSPTIALFRDASSGALLVDEGEEPEEDDTPVVIPEP